MEPKVLGINHIGIAVKNLEDAKKLYCDVLGFEKVEEKRLEGRKVSIVFLKAGATMIELLEGIGENSPVSKFVEKRGEGIHHICYEVENIEETLRAYEEKGITLIDREARPGAEGKPVAFLHPKSTGGVLLEVMQV